MGGFWAQKIHVDGKLEGISENFYDPFVNVSSRNEHAPEA